MTTYSPEEAFKVSILSPSDMVQLSFGLCPFCGNPVHPLSAPSLHAQRCVPCDKVFFLDENLSGAEPSASVRAQADPRLPLSGKTSFLPPYPPPVEEAPPTRLAEEGAGPIRRGNLRAQEEEYGSIRRKIEAELSNESERGRGNQPPSWPYPTGKSTTHKPSPPSRLGPLFGFLAGFTLGITFLSLVAFFLSFL